ncbi:chitinase-3-like protein 1 [Bombus pyrosoma]|uniref:chitinase-3-like protein 1 n=1 Tax=Bombus pyrosoma TaxID=396416 RepID=UPI001CB9C777|nr:chitinase-3-like protein 1 [Bombus pyrosoma]
MSKILFLIAFIVYATAIIKADKKIVCYYGSWSAYRRGLGQFEPTDIDPNLCTHIIYTFVGISEDGNVRILDSWLDLPNGRDGYGKFTRLRQLNPETKALIAIGGWNEGSTKYSNVVANPNVRARFVQNVIRFLKTYDFDGFDFDWEYPNQRGGKPADKENYIALLKELREEFDKHGYILSVAVAAAEVSASKSYLISQVSQYPHIINLMAYDLNGSWNNFAAINAPLYPSSEESGEQAKLNVNSSVQYWLAQGAPADKLILGVPAYGRSFTLSSSAYNTIGSPTIGPGRAGPYTQESGMLGYNEICEYIKQGWTVQREPEQRVPYAFKDNQWVGYDDVISLEEKAKYVMSKGLGGMMMWSVETDDFHGTCGDKYPLLHSINRVLRGYIPPPSPTSTPTRLPKPDSSTVTRPLPTSSTTALPSSTPSDSICTQEGFVRDPKDCSIFYYCQQAYNKYLINRFHCPSGLVFDTSFNGCNYRYNVPDC